MTPSATRVSLGRITGLHGVRGWVKVFSYTQPRDNIVNYRSWTLEKEGVVRSFELEAGRTHGKGLVAKLRGLDDRDQASEWVTAEISVERTALPPCSPGEYYWTDLEGLEVRDVAGQVLGSVSHMLATGANDVIVLAGSGARMIPFVASVVKDVDLASGLIVVDWEFSAD